MSVHSILVILIVRATERKTDVILFPSIAFLKNIMVVRLEGSMMIITYHFRQIHALMDDNDFLHLTRQMGFLQIKYSVYKKEKDR